MGNVSASGDYGALWVRPTTMGDGRSEGTRARMKVLMKQVARRRSRLPQLVLLAGLLGGCAQPEPSGAGATEAAAGIPAHDPTVFETTIDSFERDDQRSPPARGGVLFVGSSSVRLWETLERDMAPMDVLNRGFGGSRTDDVLHYAHRIVLPYHPRAIVFYAGDNDLGRDKDATPESVAEHFERLVETVEQAGQRPDIYFVSIKPSPARMKRWSRMHAANELVAAYAMRTERVSYLDVSSAMLGEGGVPRAELYRRDGLHMNARGYDAWTRVIRPAVMSEVGPNPLFM